MLFECAEILFINMDIHRSLVPSVPKGDEFEFGICRSFNDLEKHRMHITPGLCTLVPHKDVSLLGLTLE